MRGRLLVIGCGRGHDVVALTALGAEAHGLDISPTAIAEARRAHPDIPKERWHIADLLDLPEGLVPAAGEAVDAFLARTIEDAKRRDDAAAVLRVSTVRQSLMRSANFSDKEIEALRA